MSFLPHNGGFGPSWIFAAGGSAAVHGVVLFAAVGMLGNADRWMSDQDTAPEFTITLQQLDTDALVGKITQEGEVGADPAKDPQTEGPEPETTLAPDVPSDGGGADDPIPLGDIAAVTDPIPSPEEPILPEQTPMANPDQMPVILPGMLSPGTASGDTVAQTISPHADEGQPEADPTAEDPEQIAGMQPSDMPDPAMSDPTASGNLPQGPDTSSPATPPRQPTQQDIALGELIDKIRATPVSDCLIALPRRDGESGAGLAMIGVDIPNMRALSSKILTDWPDDIRQTQVLIDPRQCPALNYVRNNSSYPASRLGIRLDSAEVPSGGRLSGIVRGVAGKSLLILVIDINGVVQSLERFTTLNDNFARFEVPVTRTSQQRDTAQILLVLATPEPARLIEDRLGQLAQDVFAGLEDHPIADAAMAITTFNVR